MSAGFLLDVWLILGKEWRGWFSWRKGAPNVLINFVVTIIVFGVLAPLAAGSVFSSHPVVLVVWAWLPMFMVTGLAVDSVAGERDRRTLETLLISRLSGPAIALGKVAAAALYGILLLVLCLAAAMIVSALALHGHHPFQVTGWVVAAALGFGLLIAVFTALVGVLVSWHAPTARLAQQLITVAALAFLLVLAVGAARLVLATPEGWAGLLAGVVPTSLELALWELTGLLAAANCLMVAVLCFAARRPRRLD